MTTPAARRARSTAARPTPTRAPVVPGQAVPVPRRPAEDRPSAAAVSPRDRSVLMAVAAGRCTMSLDQTDGLLVDGRPCADQFAGHRLVRAGLVRLVGQPAGRPHTAELTPAGIALLGLPITV